jgi:D-3-phosphoglycerate dehydrogenase
LLLNHSVVLFTDADHTVSEADQHALQASGAKLLPVRTRDEFIAASGSAAAVLNSNFPITADLIETLNRCRVISRYGSGYDNIDVAAASRKRIPVCNVPAFCIEEVANRAMTLLLAASCELLRLDRFVRAGTWGVHNLPYAYEVEGRTLGLVGFGKIARAVARRARPFGFRIIAYDPYVEREIMAAEQVEARELDELLATSDYISVHTPLNAGTRHLLDNRRLALLKPSAVLINTSRGAVIDEAGLVDALKNRRFAGAGLDVFEHEPPDRNNPLFAMDNVTLTPHCAAHTQAATERLHRVAIGNILRALRGEPLQNVLNPESIAVTTGSDA